MTRSQRRRAPVLTAALLLVSVLLAACGAEAPEPSGGGEAATRPTASPETPSAVPSPGAGEPGQPDEPLRPPDDFTRLPGVVDVASLESRPSSLAGWRTVVPRVQDVQIPSTADGSAQPALWLPPQGEGPQPLIVALHSWSTRYEQYVNTPFGRWADQEGWAMIAPDFRGVYEKPAATASDLAVQDVVDAVEWAVDQGGVEEDEVFVVGFSGGGLMSLVMAGRHPDLFAGAVSFVPIYDLVDWYVYNRGKEGDRPARYARQIAASCGGDPTSDPAAREQCLQRSPKTYLDAAREAGLPIFIGHGLHDETVPPDHGVRAFNQLADPQDRLSPDVLAAVTRNTLPPEVAGEPAESFFGEQDPEVLLARRSGPVTLVLFDGEHDMVFHPALAFLAALAQQR